jgi:hypothetical protein
MVQRLRGDDVREPVGAEKVAVAGHGLAYRQVRLGLTAAVERPQDQRALRMRGRLLHADPALIDQ